MCGDAVEEDRWLLSPRELCELLGGELIKICDGAVISRETDKTAPNDPEIDAPSIGRLVIDSRALEPGDVFVALRGEHGSGEAYAREALGRGAAAVVCSAGGAERIGGAGLYIEVRDVQVALAQGARAVRERCGATVIAVTGSVGKTTTRELCVRMLSERFRTDATAGNRNNELGVPLSLLNSHFRAVNAEMRGNSPRFMVLELGIGKLGDMDELACIASPDIAVITNIGSMHIGRFSSREEIAREKLKLLECERCHTVVFNGDDALLSDMIAQRDGLRRIPVLKLGGEGCGRACAQEWLGFGDMRCTAEDREALRIEGYLCREEMGACELTVGSLGEHIALDCALAAAVARICGCDREDIRRGATAYRPVGLRQRIFECGGILRIVDCYNSGPESVRAALSALSLYAEAHACKRRIAVLGDMLELGEHSEYEHRRLGEVLAQYGTDILFTVGEPASEIAISAVKHGVKPENTVVFRGDVTAEEIKSRIEERLEPGDAVLYKASRGVRLERVIAGLEERGADI